MLQVPRFMIPFPTPVYRKNNGNVALAQPASRWSQELHRLYLRNAVHLLGPEYEAKTEHANL
jgi:hypothetical protein